MISWWHRRVLHHMQVNIPVSVPMWDIGSRGILRHCQCGKAWAL